MLLIDDTIDNQRILGAFLRSDGHEVICCGSGEEGLTAFERDDDFDLVLLDLMMPGLDGYQTLVELRGRDTRDPPVPVVALTAHTLPEDVARCEQAGFDGHLAKPVSRRQLIDAVRGYVDEDPGPDAALAAALQDLLPDFIARRHEDAVQLKRAVAQGDLDTVRLLGHRMAGSGTTYGFPLLSEIGRGLERAAEEGAAAVLQELIARFEAELRRITEGPAAVAGRAS